MAVKLTPKQRLFVVEYLIDLNATQAAIRAGYSKKTACKIGSENLQKPDIARAIQAGADKRAKRTEIDLDWVLRSAVAVHDRCMQKEPVLDKDGNETGVYKFEPNAANKAIELAGKHVNVQAFNEKATLEVTEKVKFVMDTK